MSSITRLAPTQSIGTVAVMMMAALMFVVITPIAFAQDKSVRLDVTVNSGDGLYSIGEEAVFTARVTNWSGRALSCKLTWNVHAVTFDPPSAKEVELQIEASQSGSCDFPLTINHAGFAEVEATVVCDGDSVSKRRRIGCAPQQVESPSTRESDSAEFWDASLQQLDDVDPLFDVVARPKQAGENADVFEVRMRSFGDVRVAGWLEIPRVTDANFKKRFPVVIRVPGYGQNMRPIDRWDDMIVFSFNPRGHGNSQQDVSGDPQNYWIRGLDDKDDYFYRGAYLDCVRAVDFIATRNDVDQDCIAIWGGSQGGGFALATAALDPRIDFCAADIPFLCDWVNYFKQTHWPEMNQWIADKDSRNWETTLRTLSYFDTLNLAERIKCPTVMGVGLQDQVCPPTTSFAAFNRILGRTSFKIYNDAGHGLGAEHWSWVWKEIRGEFGLTQADGVGPSMQDFEKWDANSDGKLSRDELPDFAKPNFQRVDTNRDGSISPQEHVAFLKRRKRTRQPAGNVPANVRVEKDISYVEDGHDRQRLDLYRPATNDKPLPLVVWVHGGGWQKGSKDGCPAVPLVRQGFVVASINYRLSSDAIFPAQIHDCKAAIRWLRANSQRYGIDPNRIGVWGSSAGGHLAALLGTSGDVAAMEGSLGNVGHSSRVQAVCDWFGPTDLLLMNQQAGDAGTIDHDAPHSPESHLLGATLPSVREKANAASPLTYVTPDDPTFLIVHGDKDTLVSWRQSKLLHDRLLKSGCQSSLEIVPGAPHGRFRDPKVTRACFAFFGQTLISVEPSSSSGESLSIPLPN